jgi:hypothetical protein
MHVVRTKRADVARFFCDNDKMNPDFSVGLDNHSANILKKTLHKYRTEPQNFCYESQDVNRMSQIRKLPQIDWKSASRQNRECDTPRMVVILDTEFILKNLKLVADVIDHLSPLVWMVIPWIVAKELDALKVSPLGYLLLG